MKINKDKKFSLLVSLICCYQRHLLMKSVIKCKYFFSNVDDGKNIFDFLLSREVERNEILIKAFLAHKVWGEKEECMLIF